LGRRTRAVPAAPAARAAGPSLGPHPCPTAGQGYRDPLSAGHRPAHPPAGQLHPAPGRREDPPPPGGPRSRSPRPGRRRHPRRPPWPQTRRRSMWPPRTWPA